MIGMLSAIQSAEQCRLHSGAHAALCTGTAKLCLFLRMRVGGMRAAALVQFAALRWR